MPEYVLRVQLPARWDDDGRTALLGRLIELAEAVADADRPPTGEVWQRSGELLCLAHIEIDGRQT
jgi:hypothetical protein